MFIVLALGFLMFTPFAIPYLIFAFIVMLFIKSRKEFPEYNQYDYFKRILEPTIKLFDEKMSLSFHYDCSDLVNEDIPYDNALYEAYMVKHFPKGRDTKTFSCCSYDWNNTNNTDAFEFLGYKIYTEYEDDNGGTHETVYFDGQIYKFRTSFYTNGIVNIMSTNTEKGVLGGEKEKSVFKKIKNKDEVVIDTENHEFSEKFDTIATYDDEAYRFLTPSMIETLLALRTDFGFKGMYGTSFSGKKPYSRSKISPQEELRNRINKFGNALLSIYELKDTLDPAGMSQGV